MYYEEISDCCTARFIVGFDKWVEKTTQGQLQFLKSQNMQYLTGHQDLAMFYTIVTEHQNREESLKKLGFTQVFTAPKNGPDGHPRHPETGALQMWCVQPWVLREKVTEAINEIEGVIFIPLEERERRKTFVEFALYRFKNHPIFREKYPNENSITLARIFPSRIGEKDIFFNVVKEMTGGFDPATDPIIVSAYSTRTLTCGLMKERALKYRNGEI